MHHNNDKSGDFDTFCIEMQSIFERESNNLVESQLPCRYHKENQYRTLDKKILRNSEFRKAFKFANSQKTKNNCENKISIQSLL